MPGSNEEYVHPLPPMNSERDPPLPPVYLPTGAPLVAKEQMHNNNKVDIAPAVPSAPAEPDFKPLKRFHGHVQQGFTVSLC